MSNENPTTDVQQGDSAPTRIDPETFPPAPKLTKKQLDELSGNIAACEQGEGIDTDKLIAKLSEFDD